MLPISYQSRLKKVEKNLKWARKRYTEAMDLDDLAQEVQDIACQCRLLLDRYMNEVWQKYNNKRPDKKKANVYFPRCETENELKEHLKRCQLAELETVGASTFAHISAIQPFQSKKHRWLDHMFNLSADKHEKDPTLSPAARHFTGIGKGQRGITIKNMTVQNGTISNLEGYGINPDGNIEPLNVTRGVEFYPSVFSKNTNALEVASAITTQTRKFLTTAFAKF